jgi:hypothetical protein
VGNAAGIKERKIEMADSKLAKGEMPDATPPEKRDEEKDNPWVQALAVVGGVALYVLLGLLLWGVLDLYIKPQDSGEKKDLVQALGLIMAGVAGAIGIYLYLARTADNSGKLTSHPEEHRAEPTSHRARSAHGALHPRHRPTPGDGRRWKPTA